MRDKFSDRVEWWLEMVIIRFLYAVIGCFLAYFWIGKQFNLF